MIFFFTSVFLIADLYEFNTNIYLQASRSTKSCVFFNTKAQSAHTCSCIACVRFAHYIVTPRCHQNREGDICVYRAYNYAS